MLLKWQNKKASSILTSLLKPLLFGQPRQIWTDARHAEYTEVELQEKIRKLRMFDRPEISHTMTMSIHWFYYLHS
jgi:hypothetical protein